MNIPCQELFDKTSPLFDKIIGDGDVIISRVSGVDNIHPGSLVFVRNERERNRAMDSEAVAIAGPENLIIDDLEKPYLVCSHPQLALSKVLLKYYPQVTPKFEIHNTAVIDESAILAQGVSVGACSVIGARVKIGKNAVIYPNCVIEDDCVIDEDTIIYPFVFIARRTEIGKRCIIKPNTTVGSEGFGFVQDSERKHHRIPQVGNVKIHDDVNIGANCTIDRATFDTTHIMSGTKLDNQCHIAHNCTVGENCIFAGGAMIGGSVELKKNVWIGGRTAIKDHITISEDIQLGAMSGVIQSFKKPGVYAGFPAMPLNEFMKGSAVFPKLNEMRRTLRAVAKKVGYDPKEDK